MRIVWWEERRVKTKICGFWPVGVDGAGEDEIVGFRGGSQNPRETRKM
jgi:hypothetical protein